MTDVIAASGPGVVHSEACRLEDFLVVVETETELGSYPHAAAVEDNILIYDAERLRAALEQKAGEQAVILRELAAALLTGPGVIVFKGAFDSDPVARTSSVFFDLIAEQRESNTAPADHFAKHGANDRVWNALEKLAVRDPQVFFDYYQNDMLALAAQAWLGPAYQVTSQVNVVNPGGAAQHPHRDYHLGFMTNAQAERFPATAHDLSPALTLQGAVAHCDMPVESGPTLYLPHSQKYRLGYLAWRQPEFVSYFEQHRTQLPLHTGDAVFFNPALFHAAGANRTSTVKRMANLLQISSAMGRALEWVNRRAMCLALYPTLVAETAQGTNPGAVARAVAACAEGYPFPTNLDIHPPVDGLTPDSQADVVHRALSSGWSIDELDRGLLEQARNE